MVWGDSAEVYPRSSSSNLSGEVLALETKRNVVNLLDKLADGAEGLSCKIANLEEQL